MAHVTPQFDIKTGADSQLFFSREITVNDVGQTINTSTGTATVPDSAVGRIKAGDVVQAQDIFKYPQLVRRTGHSLTGTTENIESQELRKGRTKSAPRKGNSSSEGSLDIELSPETYDDIFEAALRNNWKPWTSDANSAIVFDFDKTLLTEGKFISNGSEKDGGLGAKYLFGWKGGTDGREDAIVMFENQAESATFEVDELTCGMKDIKFSALAQYGGVEGQDLYQEFQHLAVNTLSLSVSPGQIVTGSFGFMGSNNPELLGTGQAYVQVATADKSEADYNAGKYYVINASGKYERADGEGKTYDPTATTVYYTAPDGIIEELADDDDRSKEGRFFEGYNAVNEKITGKTPAEAKVWVDDLAEKVGTKTDQFTAREGFLYINGHRVQYGSNLTLELNNGLKQIFAIFERGSISTTSLTLDITGTLDAYLIKGYSENLYNMCTNDKDVEIVFCFQDKEDNPEYLYVVQIFTAKFTQNDISQGTEELTLSLPFQSFGERAMRMFRFRKKTMDCTLNNTAGTLNVTLVAKPTTATGLIVTATKSNGTAISLTPGTYDATTGIMPYTFTSLVASDVVTVKMSYDGRSKTKTYNVDI